MIKNLLQGWRTARQNRTISRYYDLAGALSSLAPELIDGLPPGNTVLAVAPHCDDEALGCGGVLRKHHLRGDALTAVFMTDGALCDAGKNTPDIAALRKQEARQASAILGIGECLFLDHPDRGLKVTAKTIRQMEDLLAKINPDIVYLPFYLDNHPDHMAAARICLTALRRGPERRVFFYELWTALIPNRVIDIGETVEKKMEAIRVYRSQKDIDGFAEKIKALNRYRSLAADGRYQYAEAFFEAGRDNMKKILEASDVG